MTSTSNTLQCARCGAQLSWSHMIVNGRPLCERCYGLEAYLTTAEWWEKTEGKDNV